MHSFARSVATFLALCCVAVPGHAELDLQALAGSNWYGLYMNGEKAGYAQRTIVVEDDGSATFMEDASFKLNMVGMKQDMNIVSRRVYGADGRLSLIESQVDDIAGRNEFRAAAEGDQLRLDSTVGGQRRTDILPMPDESIDDILQGVRLVTDDPAIGKSIEFGIFEPMYKRTLEARSEIVGVEERTLDGVQTQVYQIKTTIPLVGISSVSYVTEDAVSLEDQIAGGIITMRLEPEAVAKDVHYQNDVIVSNAATVDAPIASPRTRSTLRLELRGPLDADRLYTDLRQSIRPVEDHFAFEGKLLAEADIASISLPIEDETVAEWQAPSTFVQSDDPRMIETAQRILGDETDALRAVELLSHWVYENVRGTFSARLTNSLEVLDNMEGDCTEHSMLFIGLARAAGIPAREVAGLIYVDEPRPGFYFHQWATVWVGTWIDVDPTFDQPIADATHIKLTEGDMFEQLQLLPIIGQLKVSVVD